MSHHQQCQRAVRLHANRLFLAVENGWLNESAVLNLLESYVDQPAYDLKYRKGFVADAYEAHGKPSPYPA